jgi:hypothetical protein
LQQQTGLIRFWQGKLEHYLVILIKVLIVKQLVSHYLFIALVGIKNLLENEAAYTRKLKT